MKLRPLLAALLLGALSLPALRAQEAAPAAAPAATAKSDLQDLIAKITTKLRAGQRTPETLGAELAEFDALLAKYPAKDDASAEIALMKAMLFVQIFHDEATGQKLLGELVANFPGTKPADAAKKALFMLSDEGKKQAAAEEAAEEAKLAALVGQPAPEINFTWSSRAGLKHLADLRGSVVVLDFWATWCGPCIASFPKVREEVAHFKSSPVVFLGITSLQGRVHGLEPKPIDTKGDPQKEYGLMPAFMQKKEMTWDVAFSEQNVFNPDYAVRGIPYIAIIDPKGVVRHTGLNPHDPEADIAGKVAALLKEFNLPAPTETKSE